MRRIFTLCFLFISCFSIAQPDSMEKVVVTGNCWRSSRQVDTVPNGLICKPIDLTKGVTGKVTSLNVQKTDSGVFGSKRIGCNGRRQLTGNSQPLLVLDGVPTELKYLSQINPINIESVEIIKSAAATAIFGPDGANGAVWVITKAAKLRKFIIKDFLDGSRIAGATVLITSVADNTERIQLIANDSGLVITDKLKNKVKYSMSVSAVGHQTLEDVFENKYDTAAKEILLSRQVITCREVVLTQIICWKKIICYGFSTRVIKTGDTPGLDQKKELFKIFPNPVSKGGTLNLEINNDNGKIKMIRFVGLDGKTILQQKISSNEGKNLLQLPTDPRWAAGIYFVQLLYENGRVAASEKIILQ